MREFKRHLPKKRVCLSDANSWPPLKVLLTRDLLKSAKSLPSCVMVFNQIRRSFKVLRLVSQASDKTSVTSRSQLGE
jgi:hypothetical protein